MSQGILFMSVPDPNKRNAREEYAQSDHFYQVHPINPIFSDSKWFHRHFKCQCFLFLQSFSSRCSSTATKPQMRRPASFLCNTIPKKAWLIILTAVPSTGRLFSLAGRSATCIIETLKPRKALTVCLYSL